MQHAIASQKSLHDDRSHVVHLRPGENLWQARLRWERATGLRGLLLVR